MYYANISRFFFVRRVFVIVFFFFSSRRRHTRLVSDWSSDVCSSDLEMFEVAQAMGYSNISGINGRVKITISQLSDKGIHVSGVNGGVELYFSEDLNAEIGRASCRERV